VDEATGTPVSIENDVTNLDFATPRGEQNSTGVDSPSNERILLLADFSLTLNGVFNPSGGAVHEPMSTVPTTNVTRTVTLAHSGQTLACEVLFEDYALSRSASGELTFTAPAVLNSTVMPVWS
jgi:hypothetical protein